MTRGVLDRMSRCHRRLARRLIDELALRKLCADDVDFLNVGQARRPCAGSQAGNAAEYFGDPLEHEQRSSDRDYGFEMVNRRALGRDRGVLANVPGVGGIAVSGIDQCNDAGDEEQKIEQ